MRINFFIHDQAEMPGAILEWSLRNDIEFSFTHFWKGDSLPDFNTFDALVVMGGPMNIYEEERFPWLIEEKIFLKEAIANGKKVLGICLGSQLIADILGSKIYRNSTQEIGWFPIELTAEGIQSELLKGLNFSMPVLHWHGDTYNIPAGAVHLFRSQACNSQAFSSGKNVLALQFHFETTIESLAEMTDMDRASLIKSEWVMSEPEILEGEKYIKANNLLLFDLLDRFLS